MSIRVSVPTSRRPIELGSMLYFLRREAVTARKNGETIRLVLAGFPGARSKDRAKLHQAQTGFGSISKSPIYSRSLRIKEIATTDQAICTRAEIATFLSDYGRTTITSDRQMHELFSLKNTRMDRQGSSSMTTFLPHESVKIHAKKSSEKKAKGQSSVKIHREDQYWYIVHSPAFYLSI